MTDEECKSKIAAAEAQMIRVAGFYDGYKAAVEYMMGLLKDEKKDEAGIQANKRNTEIA